MSNTEQVEIAIIGAGPAGLMAAETLVNAGHKPVLFDAMPTPARKFLMAGKSGLNLTHTEEYEKFLSRYSAASERLAPALQSFAPEAVRSWADDLGAETFEGSSGRIFPKVFKASPLLRAWIGKITEGGAEIRTRHTWTGWDSNADLTFRIQAGHTSVKAAAVILAMGGSSWPRLGSDGGWRQTLMDSGVFVTPFRPANCGFLVNWSPIFKERFAGEPVKNSVLSAGNQSLKGDFVISGDGIEGSAVYGLSAPLRDTIETDGFATLHLDLTPDRSRKQLVQALSKPQGKRSFSNHLKKATGLSGVKANLLRECLPQSALSAPETLASSIKHLPLTLTACRPIEEAISVAGGIPFDELDSGLMIKSKPGVFACGEMLDWEAPTGGYLLTACFAQGKQAAQGALSYLAGLTSP